MVRRDSDLEGLIDVLVELRGLRVQVTDRHTDTQTDTQTHTQTHTQNLWNLEVLTHLKSVYANRYQFYSD